MSEKKSPLVKVADRMGLNEHEAATALKSSRAQRSRPAASIPISKNKFKFAYFSDPHIGEKHFSYRLFDYMARYLKMEKPDFILNPGDHLEGMSGRPGHVYDLSHVGFKQQSDEAVRLYSQLNQFEHYGIDGNHDQWYEKKNDNGVIVGDMLQDRVKNFHNLGQDEGNINVNGVRIRLFHAGDGTAYATSYKLQKLIESFSSNDKPHIVLSGHYHKAMSMWSRGVFGVECGTLCGQSKWMKTKKIPAHMGFGMMEVVYNKKGVERLTHTFVPWEE